MEGFLVHWSLITFVCVKGQPEALLDTLAWVNYIHNKEVILLPHLEPSHDVQHGFRLLCSELANTF